MKRLKVRKGFKLFSLGFLILCINLKVAIPRFIENCKLKSNEMLVTNYIKGYSNNIDGVANIEEKKLIKKIKKKYIGAIEIPSIKLKQGLAPPNSKDNYVKYRNYKTISYSKRRWKSNDFSITFRNK